MKPALLALAASLFLLSACNTIEGFGRDMQRGGEKMEEAAKKK